MGINVPCAALSPFSRVQHFATLWTVACQAPLSMEILQATILEWVAIPFSEDLPNSEIEPGSHALQAYSLWPEPPEKPKMGH